MKFNILTLFPEIFPAYLGHSLAGEALKKQIWEYTATDIKQFGLGKHRNVDDTPYGGGAGMVMRADVLGTAIESLPRCKTIYMSPRGIPLTQNN